MQTTHHPTARSAPRLGVILAIVAAAEFMIVLDVAIVNVALPSIQRDLSVAQSSLQWIAIAYGLCFGGFLLLGGRAADLFGRRRMLTTGFGLFILSSLAAGLAGSAATLIAARAAQGLGAALIAPAALSILTNSFAEGPARNRALAVFGAVAGSGASAGVTLGGALTSGPGWEWIFYINVPIGVVLVAAARRFLPESADEQRGGFDALGAVVGTAGLLLLVYGLNKGVDWGWTAGSTMALLGGAVALLGLFLAVEANHRSPLVPLRIFRNRSLAAANGAMALLFGAFFPTVFISTLYMQQGLGFSAMRTGLFYLGLSGTFMATAAVTGEKLIARTGVRPPLIAGPLIAAGGLLWLSRAPADGSFLGDLFPGFLLTGIGMGLSVISAQIAAFAGVDPAEAGLASGLVTTSQEVGGALGVAVASTVALASTQRLLLHGTDPAVALTGGFGDGYIVAAVLLLASAVVGAVGLARREAVPLAAERSPLLAEEGDAA